MTHTRTAAALALVAATGAAALAVTAVKPVSAQPAAPPPAAKSQNQCFYRHDINGFAAPDDHTVYIRIGLHEVYRLDLMSNCDGLSFKQRIALESDSNDDWVCDALGESIVIHDTGIPQRCEVQTMTKLTREQADALKGRSRP